MAAESPFASPQTVSPVAASRPAPIAPRLSLQPEVSRRDFYTGGREPDPRFGSAEPERGGERRETGGSPGRTSGRAAPSRDAVGAHPPGGSPAGQPRPRRHWGAEGSGGVWRGRNRRAPLADGARLQLPLLPALRESPAGR